MQYLRLLIVCFVALGLTAWPAAAARAVHSWIGPDATAYAGSVFDVAAGAAPGDEPIRRDGAPHSALDTSDLESIEDGEVLEAVAALILTVVDAGRRAGVLAVPEVKLMVADVLRWRANIEESQESAAADRPRSDVGNATPNEEGFVTSEAVATSEAVVTSASGEPLAADPVERWRPLVEQYFADEHVAEALSIIGCESNGDPSVTNARSGAAGLFQFISGTWEHASEQAGFGGASALDPEANTAAAAWLVEYSLDGGRSAWAHWTCRP